VIVRPVARTYAADVRKRTARLAAILILGSTVACVAVRSAPGTDAAADRRAAIEEFAPLLAYSDGQSDSEIHLVRADGSGHRVLTDNRLNDRLPAQGPAWSPDGRRLVYVLLNRHGVPNFYVRDVDGPGLVRVGSMLARYEWSRDGRKVLTKTRSWGILRVVDVASGTRQELYDGGLLDAFGWSPDGTRVVYATDRFFGPRVFVVNADGTGRRRLVRNGTEPAWSPDGRLIAFLRDVSDRYSTVYVVRPDGTGLRRLSPTRFNSVDQWEWAPDGRTLAISQYLRNAPNRLGVLDAERGGVRWLSKGRRYWGRFQWTPDGSQIVFVCGGLEAYGLCLADVATGRVRKVTRTLHVNSATWSLSPDAKKLAFTTDNGVHVWSAEDSRRVRRLTPSGYFLSWSPEGEWISVQGTGLNVVRLRDAFEKRIAQTYDGGAWQPLRS
jgi:Tol biopolymer transport system component